MKSLQKQMADNVKAINDASETLGICIIDLQEQKSAVSAEVAFHHIMDISLRRQRRLRSSQRRECRISKRTIETPFRSHPTPSDC